eukprot:augustus_masked-scaffold_18-processed-gene-0.2-mRNA-1 protein AED:1.00 eAED:1.00 QI:0/-1/0/0/-1/1/1/0/434
MGQNLVINRDVESDDESSLSSQEQTSGGFDYEAYYREKFPERYKEKSGSKQMKLYETDESPVALICFEDLYVRNLVLKCFKEGLIEKLTGRKWMVLEEADKLKHPIRYLFGDYEQIDWFSQAFKNEQFICSCYYNRKALIRKANVCNILISYARKKKLTHFIPNTLVLEIKKNESPDYDVMFFDFSRKRYIIKPSMTNQAKGIVLVESQKQLDDAFKELSEDELVCLGGLVVQEYIEPPYLISKGIGEGRKFHLRVFVCLVGNLKAYVFDAFLSIFSLEKYENQPFKNTKAHLTNYSHQKISNMQEQLDCMMIFPECGMNIEKRKHFEREVKKSVGKVVEAVSFDVGFRSSLRQNCFEIFGFDFVIDDHENLFFLEANAEPDLATVGERLEGVIEIMLNQAVALSFGTDLGIVKEIMPNKDEFYFEKVYEKDFS